MTPLERLDAGLPDGPIIVVRTRYTIHSNEFQLSALMLEPFPRQRGYHVERSFGRGHSAHVLREFMEWASKCGPGLTFAAVDLALTWASITEHLGPPHSPEDRLWKKTFPYQLCISSFARAIHRDLYMFAPERAFATRLPCLVEEDAECLYRLLKGVRHVYTRNWTNRPAPPCHGEMPFEVAPATAQNVPFAHLLPASRPLDDWDEKHGPVLWWKFPVCEPPYVGTPLDDDFPEYVTHWTAINVPLDP